MRATSHVLILCLATLAFAHLAEGTSLLCCRASGAWRSLHPCRPVHAMWVCRVVRIWRAASVGDKLTCLDVEQQHN